MFTYNPTDETNNERSKTRYRNREWVTLQLGSLKLPKPTRLTIHPLAMPGTQVMDLKHVKLNLRLAE